MMEIYTFCIFLSSFIVFILVNVFGKSKFFGIFAGFILIIFGISILASNISIPMSVIKSVNYTMVTIYSNVTV